MQRAADVAGVRNDCGKDGVALEEQTGGEVCHEAWRSQGSELGFQPSH